MTDIGDDPRQFYARPGGIEHIRRPDAPAHWDWVQAMIYVGRIERGQKPAYCGADTAHMMASAGDGTICARCLRGYYADEDAD